MATETGSANNEESRSVTLVTKDDQEFVVDTAIANRSNMIKTMINNPGSSMEKDEKIVLKEVAAADFKNVLTWAENHKDDGPKLSEQEDVEIERRIKRTGKVIMDTWDEEFFNTLDRDTVFALVLAANYLEIKELLDSLCKYLALRIKGKPIEEVKDYFSSEENEKNKKEEKNSK